MKKTIAALAVLCCIACPVFVNAETEGSGQAPAEASDSAMAEPAAPLQKPAKASVKKQTKPAAKPAAAKAKAAKPADGQAAAAGEAGPDAKSKARDKKAAKPDAAESPTPAPAPAHKDDYESWLEKYGAWDRLDKVYSKDGDSPDVIFKRAKAAMQNGAPSQALAILESVQSFGDEQAEAQRLWMGGQACRVLGDPSKAVYWFSQAGTLMNERDLRAKFSAEPGLEAIWPDVCRRFFWIYSANATATSDSQSHLLRLTLKQAETVWGGKGFWTAARKAMEVESGGFYSFPGDAGLAISDQDKQRVAQVLGLLALKRHAQAQAALQSLESEELRSFWAIFVQYFEGQALPEQGLTIPDYPKAEIFWRSNMLVRYGNDLRNWTVEDEPTAAWAKFQKKVSDMKDEKILEKFEKDKDSDLISLKEPAPALAGYKVALALAAGRSDLARAFLDKAPDKSALPALVKTAAVILFDIPPFDLAAQDQAESSMQLTLIPVLASAGGAQISTTRMAHFAPFWIRMGEGQLRSSAQQDWPLDRLLILASLAETWQKSPSHDLAKRLAFLFPESEAGVLASISLANSAIADKQYQLADFYLRAIDDSWVTPSLKASLMSLRGDLAYSMDDKEAAMNYYREVVRSGGTIPDLTKLRLAFLLQQKGELKAGQKQLQDLWDKHESMPTSTQAELLYYLAEGEQALGNIDKALDHYMRLAFQYPQENIWAITAMFRAALLYEQRAQYDTARNLLQTVIRNAETPQQREAAQNRLADIESKMTKVQPDKSSQGQAKNIYPF